MENKTIKAYKGFNKDMACRGFAYEEGKRIKADTWYKFVDGEFTECDD